MSQDCRKTRQLSRLNVASSLRSLDAQLGQIQLGRTEEMVNRTMVSRGGLSRRAFLRRSALHTVTAGTAYAAGVARQKALALGVPRPPKGSGRKFKVGLIGCGGRGTDAARNAIEAATKQGDQANIVAVADVFQDRVERARRIFHVDEKNCFVGFDAFQKLLDLECDYVILATPPHFRPEHFHATVRAERHIFTESPVAVDAPGVRRFLAAGEYAKAKKLSVVAGTYRRHQEQYREVARRVAEGAIGKIISGRCYTNMGGLWSVAPNSMWTDMEWQLRNWLYFTWLSGDHVVERHIHQLDVMNWLLGRHPIAARGIGGRQVRTGKKKYGNVYDHFTTELVYANPKGPSHPPVRVTSMCRQIDGCWNEISEELIGTAGSTDCKSRIFANGAAGWEWSGAQVNPYVQAHIDLQASIKKDDGQLNEAESVAHSTMTAILCRASCYSGREVTWEEALNNKERLGPDQYELGPLAIADVPMPGTPM